MFFIANVQKDGEARLFKPFRIQVQLVDHVRRRLTLALFGILYRDQPKIPTGQA
jgi:hypothetical protein